ncbi:hypothetical protein BJV77DRAFT_1046281 [Russula vinacea]|nr:hypothetical protein BJV77DRAFT_1054579 [Russula vinacea]KAH9981690.1 hypothetical protein BJV77DRAFT_1046281 [Russula vinacea]
MLSYHNRAPSGHPFADTRDFRSGRALMSVWTLLPSFTLVIVSSARASRPWSKLGRPLSSSPLSENICYLWRSRDLDVCSTPVDNQYGSHRTLLTDGDTKWFLPWNLRHRARVARDANWHAPSCNCSKCWGASSEKPHARACGLNQRASVASHPATAPSPDRHAVPDRWCCPKSKCR